MRKKTCYFPFKTVKRETVQSEFINAPKKCATQVTNSAMQTKQKNMHKACLKKLFSLWWAVKGCTVKLHWGARRFDWHLWEGLMCSCEGFISKEQLECYRVQIRHKDLWQLQVLFHYDNKSSLPLYCSLKDALYLVCHCLTLGKHCCNLIISPTA